MSDSNHTVIIILGTRPEIIKCAPIIMEFQSDDWIDAKIIHTGQHYDSSLSDDFFNVFDLPQPYKNLEIGSGSHGEQTADGIRAIEDIISEIKPDGVIAQGDTNSVVSSAIAASKMTPEFIHVEAGIRSFNRSMPEEINRVVADCAADIAFTPTSTATENLHQEAFAGDSYMVGNTVADVCKQYLPIAKEQSRILNQLKLEKKEYVLTTIHRPINTDNEERLFKILESVNNLYLPVIFPVHPRTLSRIDNNSDYDGIDFVSPLNYTDFLTLMDESIFIVTDSGGLQEEASILEIPCLTVRPNTERPETVKANVNRLVNPSELKKHMEEIARSPDIQEKMTGHPDLYGEGDTAEKISRILESYYY